MSLSSFEEQAIHQQHQNTTFLKTNAGRRELFDLRIWPWHSPNNMFPQQNVSVSPNQCHIHKLGLCRGEKHSDFCLGCGFG